MNTRVITTQFDGTQVTPVPLFRGGVSAQHFALFNSTPAAGFGLITPKLAAHYADSADLLVPPLWQGSVDVTLFDGIGGAWPLPRIAYSQASFAASQQALAVLSGAFVDAYYQAHVGAVTITDGAGPVVVTPDYSTRLPGSMMLNASGPFSGSVDIVATGGLAKLASLGGQLVTVVFTGVEDFIDINWPVALSSYVAVTSAASAAGAFVNIVNKTTNGCRLVPAAPFVGLVEFVAFPTPINPLLQSFTATFNGTQDSIAATWTDPGIAFSVLIGVTVTDGFGGIFPYLTSRSSTGATVNASSKFSGNVDLVIVPNT